jgi:hypothetical protein
VTPRSYFTTAPALLRSIVARRRLLRNRTAQTIGAAIVAHMNQDQQQPATSETRGVLCSSY